MPSPLDQLLPASPLFPHPLPPGPPLEVPSSLLFVLLRSWLFFFFLPQSPRTRDSLPHSLQDTLIFLFNRHVNGIIARFILYIGVGALNHMPHRQPPIIPNNYTEYRICTSMLLLLPTMNSPVLSF